MISTIPATPPHITHRCDGEGAERACARMRRCGGTVEETAGGCARVNGDLAVSRGFGDADYKQTGGPGPEDRPVLGV